METWVFLTVMAFIPVLLLAVIFYICWVSFKRYLKRKAAIRQEFVDLLVGDAECDRPDAEMIVAALEMLMRMLSFMLKCREDV